MTTLRQTGASGIKRRRPLLFLFLLLFPLYGGYYSFSVLLCGAVLTGLILFRIYRDGRLSISTDAAAWCLNGICISHLISVPFAVSTGRAFIGFLRTLVWILFYTCAADYSDEERSDILDVLALEGAALSLLSTLAFLYTYFSGGEEINGRVDGFFQYANSWALYQLICIILLVMKKKRRVIDWLAAVILVIGVFLTGSRAVILLMAVMAIVGATAYAVKLKKILPVVIAAVLVAAAAVMASWLTGGMVLDRIRRVTLSSSTLIGRLLYWADGLEILWKHPFGVGYGGYVYIQSAIQTAVYTVRYVHNEYLQAALDGGIPAGLLILALVCVLALRKSGSARERAVILAIAAHSFIDADLQYSAIMLLLLFCGKGNRHLQIQVKRKLAAAVCAGLVILCFTYFANVYFLDFRGASTQSWRLFPSDLELAEKHLADVFSAESSEADADRIIAATDYSELAWHRKYLASAQRDDLPEMLKAKYQYLLLNRYRRKVWNDFTVLLENAWDIYDENALVAEYARAAENELQRTMQRTKELAWSLSEKPSFGFAEDILARLSVLEEAKS